MEPARVRFLEEGEEPVLPKWTKLLPQRWRQRKTVDTYPYTLTRVDGVLTGILQAERTAVLTADWRRGAVRLLAALEEAGAAIIVPPAEGEFPRERLPFAEGRRLAQLFAFAGAAEALRRQGRNPEESAFLLAGGEPHIRGRVLSSLGNEVNRLAIFTQEPETAEGVVQRLYAERGLMAEVFSSPKNAALGAADVVLSCGMEQRAYEHILKRGCIWLDFAGNRPVLRRLRSLRPDISAAEGFFFRMAAEGGEQMEGRLAEARAYLGCAAFREGFSAEDWDGERLFSALQEKGFSVSGFSAFGKRVKIKLYPDKKP